MQLELHGRTFGHKSGLCERFVQRKAGNWPMSVIRIAHSFGCSQPSSDLRIPECSSAAGPVFRSLRPNTRFRPLTGHRLARLRARRTADLKCAAVIRDDGGAAGTSRRWMTATVVSGHTHSTRGGRSYRRSCCLKLDAHRAPHKGPFSLRLVSVDRTRGDSWNNNDSTYSYIQAENARLIAGATVPKVTSLLARHKRT